MCSIDASGTVHVMFGLFFFSVVLVGGGCRGLEMNLLHCVDNIVRSYFNEMQCSSLSIV